MIRESMPLTLAEVSALAGDNEKGEKIKDFIKKIIKMSVDDAKKMKEELKNLEILKLRENHIVKIIDFMPENAVDIAKIAPDISLDQDEVDKILEVVKKY